MFAISLDASDRETINEIANREPSMELVREEMMNSNADAWMSDDTDVFVISMINLERYLRFAHNVHISQAN